METFHGYGIYFDHVIKSREKEDVLGRESPEVYHAWVSGGQVTNISRTSRTICPR